MVPALDSPAPASQRPTDPVAVSWSPQQLSRIDQEWRQLQRSFAYHPSVRVMPLHGDPPDDYQIEFRVRSVAVGDAGELEYRTSATVRIYLPHAFPQQPPIVQPLEAIFHPNVTSDSILIIPAWEASSTLVDLVQRIGSLLAYQTFDPWAAGNPVALNWLNANTAYLPTDPNATFHPDAGGTPIARLRQHAPAALRQVRGQLQQLSRSLLDPKNAPPFNEIERITPKLRMGARLFTGDGLPAELRDEAAQLSNWAEQLRQHVSLFENICRRKSALLTAANEVEELSRLSAAMQQQIAHIEPWAASPPTPMEAALQIPRDAQTALPHLPLASKLRELAEWNRTLVLEFEQHMTAAREKLDAILRPIPALPPLPLPMETLLRDELAQMGTVGAENIRRLSQAITSAEPSLRRGRQETDALQRVLIWRQFAELSAMGDGWSDRLRNWGSAGIQAYHLINDSGQYGPYELEQRLDLGGAAVAVRTSGPASAPGMEVWDLKTGLLLGRAENSDISVPVTDPQNAQTYSTAFRRSASCTDAANQLALIMEQSNQTLNQLVHGSTAQAELDAYSNSWCGRMAAILSTPQALNYISAEYQLRADNWRSFYFDLIALAPFKERLATYRLVNRVIEAIPLFQKALADARSLRQSSNEHLTRILSRCSRDIETEKPIMPAKYAKEYAGHLRTRDAAQADIKRIQWALKTFAKHVQARVENPETLGSGTPPQLTLLSALPKVWADLSPALLDSEIEAAVASIEQSLQASLWTNRPSQRDQSSESDSSETSQEMNAEYAHDPSPDDFVTQADASSGDDSSAESTDHA